MAERPLRPIGTPNLGFLLRDPAFFMNERLLERVAEAGFSDIRIAHTAVFHHVRDAGSRITELAERAQVTKPTVVYLVNDLEAMGYVERVPDPGDGRAKLVRLTEHGLAAREAGRAAVAEIEAEWGAALGEERLAKLRELLLELRAFLWP
ncbi:MAG: winged helix-turn-helix transcriptional regulator [Thermoleophilaceae bacterium]|nr:winged helix-turn-helix transcriptional regulator [Thermoleophilaceae bacterium]